MSLTTKTLGRGLGALPQLTLGAPAPSVRWGRLAAGSLIAVAALTLTACQEGPGSASGPSSPASATHGGGGSPGAQPPGSKTQPSGGEGHASEGAGQPSTGGAKPTGGKASPSRPSSAEANTSPMTSSDRCTADNMSLRLGREDIGAGNIRVPLVFTNKGETACSLRGFPGVSLIKRDGSTVGKPATREGAAGGAVRLQPGKSAHAVLHTINDGLSDTPCWDASQLVYVYPPGSKDAMTTSSRGLRVCGGRFSVTTVEAGSLG
ncbi:DUF4232 domain-containing protein [Streptomyces halobius]|uniref:DUF4232 domain-containing protein n=1 Tax=Streptomyces halobius TaxID=2879846 RepID=A0ABY4LZK9_9ACTN|nr:DUF4232 domain-containing protein [Streptomyces halobius]UQA90935.1 DUF4232 domain-containing protein [Streptomyces halobius]